MGTIKVEEKFCPKNHSCPTVRMCPAGAISQKSPYSAPEIDYSKCTNCGLCTQSCYAFVSK
ncbi:MAG: 4Fe-4S ferredoxin [Marinilabiliales bacterium]|nr:MAG: 4Fe-4S ferredoxin [Marinilabiliales bacterium]